MKKYILTLLILMFATSAFAAGNKFNVIREYTAGNGVEIDPSAGTGVLLKDNVVTAADAVLTNLTASRIVASDATKKLESVDLVNWVDGTANQITVTDDTAGSVTISIPTDPIFQGAPTISDFTNATHDHSNAANADIIPTTSVEMDELGTATYDDVQDYIKTQGSAGQISGGVISDAGSQTFNVEAGKGYIRDDDGHVEPIFSFDWSASNGIAIADDTILYVGVEYNFGTPQIFTTVTFSDINGHDNFYLGNVTREGVNLHILNVPDIIAHGVGHVIERFKSESFKRISGLVIGEDGVNRYVAMTSGVVLYTLNELDISAVDTNPGVGDTFDSYTGVTQTSSGNSVWDNQNYDSGGSITALSNNWFGNLWFYIEPNDGNLVCVYGTVNTNLLSIAEAEGVPDTIPKRLQAAGLLIGRIAFKKGASVASMVETEFAIGLTSTGATEHPSLATLAWGDSGHSGTASNFAGFDGAGAATYYPEEDYVKGPAAASSRAVAIFDGTTGKLIQNSTVLVGPNGDLGITSTVAGGRPIFYADNNNNDAFGSRYEGWKLSASPADDDQLNVFAGYGSSDTEFAVLTPFGYMEIISSDVTDVNMAGEINFWVKVNDIPTKMLSLMGYTGTPGDSLVDIAAPVTKPLQPSFIAALTSTVSDATGDGTVYNFSAVGFTEVAGSDRGGDFDAATGVFTAPITGQYHFTFFIRATQVDGSTIDQYLVTSNRTYRCVNKVASVLTTSGENCSLIADMDVSDTAFMRIAISGGTQVADIIGGNSFEQTWFSGYLIH